MSLPHDPWLHCINDCMKISFNSDYKFRKWFCFLKYESFLTVITKLSALKFDVKSLHPNPFGNLHFYTFSLWRRLLYHFGYMCDEQFNVALKELRWQCETDENRDAKNEQCKLAARMRLKTSAGKNSLSRNK